MAQVNRWSTVLGVTSCLLVLHYYQGIQLSFNSMHAKLKHVSRPWLVNNIFITHRGNLEASRSHETGLQDLLITVKTTGNYHKTRVDAILDTWWTLARDQTYFFTDTEDPDLSHRTNGQMVKTQCKQNHNRIDLCCKSSAEFDFFVASKKRWMCHVDDDAYVNVPTLLTLLQKHDHSEEWYLGKKSVPQYRTLAKITVQFATGFIWCLSRPLALRMVPYMSANQLTTWCNKLRVGDDVTIGYIIIDLLKCNLTRIQQFNTPYENAKLFNKTEASGITWGNQRNRLINIEGFSIEDDPTRFKSIHCRLFPASEQCEQMKAQQQERAVTGGSHVAEGT